jgi:hypothetical protein
MRYWIVYYTRRKRFNRQRKKERKKEIKHLIYENSKSPLNIEEKARASGLIAFIKDCEPNYFNKLALKYGPSFYALARPPAK